ncbi:MAG: M4 family metallopeptidase [Stackebrandtia sp.]
MKRLLAAGGVLGLAAVGLVATSATAEEPDSTPSAAQAADAFVKSDDSELMINENDDFVRIGVQSSLGMNFVSYERTHKGVPVIGGDFVVAVDDSGEVRYARTGQQAEVSVSTEPGIDAGEADGLAAETADGETSGEAELVVLAWDDSPALAWESVVSGAGEDGAPALTHVFTDADSGEVLETYEEIVAGTGNTYYNGRPGAVEFGSTDSGGQFVMEDPDRPGVSCGPDGGDPYTSDDDTWGDGTGTDLETACVDAMYSAAEMWDMMSGWLGRNGVDGEGNGFPMYVGLDMVNAYWTGSSAHFGHSTDEERQITPMDVVAHELGHGVFQFTPGGAGGAGGGNETGGINEGTGDIFGTLSEWHDNQSGDGFDAPDYLVGESAGLLNAGEPIRDMANPAAFDHPACWSSDIPNTEVHAAAGPINHWFYLTAEGTAPGGDGKPGSETCDGSTLDSGIGIEAAGKIWMGALNGKTSGWTYKDARQAALEFAATTDEFSTCAEFDQAQKAFDAVSVPTDGDPTCEK